MTRAAFVDSLLTPGGTRQPLQWPPAMEDGDGSTSDRGDAGRRHRQGSDARRSARARGRREEIRRRARIHALRLELRLLRAARPDDAGRLVRAIARLRSDLLR